MKSETMIEKMTFYPKVKMQIISSSEAHGTQTFYKSAAALKASDIYNHRMQGLQISDIL